MKPRHTPKSSTQTRTKPTDGFQSSPNFTYWEAKLAGVPRITCDRTRGRNRGGPRQLLQPVTVRFAVVFKLEEAAIFLGLRSLFCLPLSLLFSSFSLLQLLPLPPQLCCCVGSREGSVCTDARQEQLVVAMCQPNSRCGSTGPGVLEHQNVGVQFVEYTPPLLSGRFASVGSSSMLLPSARPGTEILQVFGLLARGSSTVAPHGRLVGGAMWSSMSLLMSSSP